MCKQAAPLFGRSVLVAEDEPLIALDIADMLELTGCVVIGPFDRMSNVVAAVAKNHIDMAVPRAQTSLACSWFSQRSQPSVSSIRLIAAGDGGGRRIGSGSRPTRSANSTTTGGHVLK